jgi:hypothetical protein
MRACQSSANPLACVNVLPRYFILGGCHELPFKRLPWQQATAEDSSPSRPALSLLPALDHALQALQPGLVDPVV